MKIAAKRLDGAHRKVEKRQTRGFALCIRIHLQVAKERERERGRGAIGSEREGRTPIKSRQNARRKCGKKGRKAGGPFLGHFFFFFFFAVYIMWHSLRGGLKHAHTVRDESVMQSCLYLPIQIG